MGGTAMMKIGAVLLVLFLTIGVTPAAWAQATYVLGPGDTIEIVVFGEAELSRTVAIKPDGTVALPLVGEVKAAGKTTEQLATELTRLYTRYLRAPRISVTVRDFRTNRVYVLGQVQRPGEYQVRPGVGVLEVLASAGGPTTRADLAKAVIIRGSTETIPLNLLEAIAKNTSPGVHLQPGDVLFVPETDRRIVVLGQVNRPGAYDLLEGQRVADLIAAAGGVTTKAALVRAFIVRGGEQIPVDLQKILAGATEANLQVRAGDMLVVPENQSRIAVLGSVAKPGTYDLVDGMRLVDAIAMAGGRGERGDLSRVVVIRLEAGRTRSMTINVNQLLARQEMAQNVPLQHGDVVYVPESGIDLRQVLQYLNAASLLRIIFGSY
ncbi:MAG: SLBB domain-containing protein [Armatimonadota bacterium]|nr:SLBB domain-containing protein [Armatimonadota bacterium]